MISASSLILCSSITFVEKGCSAVGFGKSFAEQWVPSVISKCLQWKCSVKKALFEEIAQWERVKTMVCPTTMFTWIATALLKAR